MKSSREWMRSSREVIRACLTANVKVTTVLGTIPASSDTVKSEVQQMKQCWKEYIKNLKNPPVYKYMYILRPSHLEELLLGEPDVVLLLVQLELKAELVPALGQDLPAGHHSLSSVTRLLSSPRSQSQSGLKLPPIRSMNAFWYLRRNFWKIWSVFKTV